ncbi:anaerobic ribonucleoside-triphosphate reductase activating protein [Stenotrophomonas sp. Iso1]|uniref:anaerobic ribonucleoside-triphosphate reductase activating protein n=1 Tax=Stenotrophomonas sp. Iso1 TaxID=2977283 RepID=UPI0022B7D032|nr:anaerobic ribonucleoside-triphosphate reductase activating protein [Stenotrophomonas sp. Iso1]
MIQVGGMTPLTTIDFPGRLAAVLFMQGCPWRCGYCHNPELLPARAHGAIAWKTVEEFLKRRQGLLDAVVFSGGEPCAQVALPGAIAQVKAMGYQVGMHTGGMYPERLRGVLPLLDWVGLDIKAPADYYDSVTGRPRSFAPSKRALDYILQSGIDYECRTTWHPGVFPVEALYRLAEDLTGRGVKSWALQECREYGRGIALTERPDLSRLNKGFMEFNFRHL